ncbi:hypothetical protein LB505_010802 [Fusarium chuoi]|nr:hypothetical protein LB505_010802 [Fusarium chuoi]
MSSDPSRFYCNYAGCERSYKKKEHLLLHERDHLNLRSFACRLCPATFNRSDLLKRHETISHPLGQGVLQDTEPSTEERVPESQEAVLAYELGESPVNALDSFLGTELQDLNLASNSAMQLL